MRIFNCMFLILISFSASSLKDVDTPAICRLSKTDPKQPLKFLSHSIKQNDIQTGTSILDMIATKSARQENATLPILKPIPWTIDQPGKAGQDILEEIFGFTSSADPLHAHHLFPVAGIFTACFKSDDPYLHI